MIALFLEAHPLVQTAIVVGALIVVVIAGLLVWAYLPLNPDRLCSDDECCADDVHPCLKENCDGR